MGVPADVVRRRPDVRRAERELAAQTARVGVATADLYPRADAQRLHRPGDPVVPRAGLVADLDRQRRPAALLGDLRSDDPPEHRGAVGAAGAGPDPVRGRRSSARWRRSRTPWSRTPRSSNGGRICARPRTRPRRPPSWRSSSTRAGLTDFTTVLIAERSLLSFQDQLNQSDGTVTANVIRLYKALGGGWTSMASTLRRRPDELRGTALETWRNQ